MACIREVAVYFDGKTDSGFMPRSLWLSSAESDGDMAAGGDAQDRIATANVSKSHCGYITLNPKDGTLIKAKVIR